MKNTFIYFGKLWDNFIDFSKTRTNLKYLLKKSLKLESYRPKLEPFLMHFTAVDHQFLFHCIIGTSPFIANQPIFTLSNALFLVYLHTGAKTTFRASEFQTIRVIVSDTLISGSQVLESQVSESQSLKS